MSMPCSQADRNRNVILTAAGALPRMSEEHHATNRLDASGRVQRRETVAAFLWRRHPDARREGCKPLSPTRSDGNYPVPEPTIKTGVVTMSTLVLRLPGPTSDGADFPPRGCCNRQGNC
jgi:hypothetical protein